MVKPHCIGRGLWLFVNLYVCLLPLNYHKTRSTNVLNEVQPTLRQDNKKTEWSDFYKHNAYDTVAVIGYCKSLKILVITSKIGKTPLILSTSLLHTIQNRMVALAILKLCSDVVCYQDQQT